MTGRRGRGGVAGPSLAAGVLLALSVPPFGFWPLAFVGAGLLFWRLGRLGLAARLVAGWFAGLGCFVVGLWWAGHFNWYGAAVLMAAESLFTAVAAALVPPRRGRLPAFAGAFTLLEAARWRWPFGGLPLGGVWLGQASSPVLATARVGGPLLMTLAVFAGGAALAAVVGPPLAELWDSAGGPRYDDGRRADGGGRPATAGAVVLAALVVVVALSATVAPDGGPPARTAEVAAVQGGGRRGLSAEQVDPATVFAAQDAATTRRAVDPGGRPRATLVVWPEDVISPSGPLAGSPEARTVARLARALDATVVAGVTVTVSSTAFRNEIVAWSPGGRIVATFEKVHRVPFGEYVPYRSFFSHLADLSAVPLDAVPGHGSGLMRTPAGPLGVMVSYEVFYDDRGRSSVRAGAELLVVPTNTSSYSTAQVPAQEVAADRVQAVAEGRDLVQAAPTGYSTVVTNEGTLRQRSALGPRQVLVATVALRRGATLYERFGDLPVLVLAALALAAGWVRSVRRRRRW